MIITLFAEMTWLYPWSLVSHHQHQGASAHYNSSYTLSYWVTSYFVKRLSFTVLLSATGYPQENLYVYHSLNRGTYARTLTTKAGDVAYTRLKPGVFLSSSDQDNVGALLLLTQ